MKALRRCSLSLVAAVSRSLVVEMLFVFVTGWVNGKVFIEYVPVRVFCQANLSWVVEMFRVNVECDGAQGQG